ncbi:MAG: hypothetical protein ACP5E4_04875, partial [Candidatus Aenigmatarchaeota archaeon]
MNTVLASSLIASAVGGAAAQGTDNYSPGFDETDIRVQQTYDNIVKGLPMYLAAHNAIIAQNAFEGVVGLYEGGTDAENLRVSICNPKAKGLSLARIAASDKIDTETRQLAEFAFQYQTAKKLGETGKILDIALSEETPEELVEGYHMTSEVRKNLAEIKSTRQIYRAIELCGEDCIPTLLYDNPNVQGKLFVDLTEQRDEEYQPNYFKVGLKSGRIAPNVKAGGIYGEESARHKLNQISTELKKNGAWDSKKGVYENMNKTTYKEVLELAEKLPQEESDSWTNWANEVYPKRAKGGLGGTYSNPKRKRGHPS